jgi:hypothetical protein
MIRKCFSGIRFRERVDYDAAYRRGRHEYPHIVYVQPPTDEHPKPVELEYDSRGEGGSSTLYLSATAATAADTHSTSSSSSTATAGITTDGNTTDGITAAAGRAVNTTVSRLDPLLLNISHSLLVHVAHDARTDHNLRVHDVTPEGHDADGRRGGKRVVLAGTFQSYWLLQGYAALVKQRLMFQVEYL